MVRTCAYLLMVFWLSAPTVASAGRLPYSGNPWTAPDTVNVSRIEANSLIHKMVERYRCEDSEMNANAPKSFILKVQQRPDLGGKGIYSYSSDELLSGTWGGKLTGEREARDRSSDRDTKSYSDFLGPSFDIPDSVDGHSGAVDPWWGRRSSADPMVQDLSHMDGGGFSSPGHAGGSAPGYHGR
ncbi:MAG: hypothetical protein A4E19_09560 [Nitrospira sp. SG-bin1]|nr:MAG: hypothetical protein A4E19_09560 [Nitrospira sp. SG-bin1]